MFRRDNLEMELRQFFYEHLLEIIYYYIIFGLITINYLINYCYIAIRGLFYLNVGICYCIPTINLVYQ